MNWFRYDWSHINIFNQKKILVWHDHNIHLYISLISYTELYDNMLDSIENASYLQAAAGFSSDTPS